MKKLLLSIVTALVALAAMADGITVRLSAESAQNAGWNVVYLYAWQGSSTQLLGSWPGIQLQEDDGWYSYTFDESIGSVNIIWNNYMESGAQTEDIEDVSESTCYAVGSGSRYASYSVVDCPSTEVIPTTLNVTPEQKIFNYHGGYDSISIESDTTWRVSSTKSFVYLYTKSGKGNGTVYFNVDSTLNEPDAEALINVRNAGGTTASVYVKRTGKITNLDVTPKKQTFGNDGGSYNVTISSDTCWTASSNQSWAQLSATSGTKDGVVTVTVSPTTELSDAEAKIIIKNCGGKADTVNVKRYGVQYTTLDVIANSSMSAIHKALGDDALASTVALRVRGTINAYDFMVFNNKMTSLKHLDLTDADIVSTANGYEYTSGYTTIDSTLNTNSFVTGNVNLETVLLPKSLKETKTNAFVGNSFKYISIPAGIIDSNALANLTGLETLEIGENVTYIDIQAFANDDGLKSILWNAIKCSLSRYSGYHSIFYNTSYNKTITFGDKVEYIPAYLIYNGVKSVTLGKNIKSIGSEAFYYGCSAINRVAYNGSLADWCAIEFADTDSNPVKNAKAMYIGDTLLTNLVLDDSIKEVKKYAFYNNTALKSISIGKNLTNIGEQAFYGCTGLEKLNYRGTVDDWCNLTFSEATANPLYYAKNLYLADTLATSIDISKNVTKINDYAFYNCQNLKTVKIPSSVLSVGKEAFGGCPNIEKIYTYTIEPTTINQNTFSCWTGATLYIPYSSRYIYWYNTQWSQFTKSEEFDEKYEYFYINGDIELGGETGNIDGKPDADLNPGSGVVVTGDEEQEMGEVTLNEDEESGASIIACENNLKVDKLTIKISITGKKWHFFCFPYDIDIKSSLSFNGKYVIREYDGETRAAEGKGGWKNIISSILNKGKGYIFNAEKSDTLTITIPNPKFSCEDAGTALQAYQSESAFDAGWNLIGNPFTSYFDLDGLFELGFTSPIIVWNGTSYDTYRPGDDDYHFSPFEGFFTQESGKSVVSFAADARETLKQAQEKIASKLKLTKSAEDSDLRKIINISLSDGVNSDKTRIVYNDLASADYEAGVDAAKFTSTQAAVQLYSLDEQQNQYSINERPASANQIMLGFSVAEDGDYTLSASRLDTPVIIYDNVLSQRIDLSEGDYTFFSQAGTDNTRFSIRPAEDVETDAVETTISAETPVDIFDLSGATIATQVMLKNIKLTPGLYIIKSADTVEKIIIK